MPDGLCCGFIVDALMKNSERRSTYAKILEAASGTLESALGCTVIRRANDRELAEQGMMRWVKVSHHRRMGTYCIHRLPAADWTNESRIAQSLFPIASHFIDAIGHVLQTHRPPAV